MKKLILLLVVLFISIGTYSAKNIKVGVSECKPFVIKQNDSTFTGLSIELWESVARDLSLDYEYVFYNENQTKTIINDVEDGIIDISVGNQTINYDRLSQISFSQPFYITELGIATNATTDAWYSIILALFSAEFMGVVLLLFIVLVILGSLIWIAERHKNDDFRKNGWGIYDGAYFMAVVMTTVGFGDKSAKTGLGRAITIVWMFVALGITGLFISSLASSMTVDKMESGLEHLSDLRKLKVATLAGTTSGTFLKNNEIKHYTYDNIVSGLVDIEKGELDAFVYDLPVLQYLIKEEGLEGSVVISEKTFDTQYYGFGINKKSTELKDGVDRCILKYIKCDDWDNMLFKYNLSNRK